MNWQSVLTGMLPEHLLLIGIVLLLVLEIALDKPRGALGVSLVIVGGATAAAAWLHFSGAGQIREGLMLTVLGCVLLLTAMAILLRNKTHSLGITIRSDVPDAFRRAQPALTVLAGSIVGLLVTLTSVGGGALGIVMLTFIYPLRMQPARLVGTDIAHAIPLTVIAGSGYLWMGNVDLPLLGKLLLGSVPGIIVGSMLAAKIPEAGLRFAIAVILSVVGCKLLFY